jgi:hypothetical protein
MACMSKREIGWINVAGLEGSYVHRVMLQADGGFVLDVSRGTPLDQEIRCACDFQIRDADGGITDHHAAKRATLERALDLPGRTVASVRYSSEGKLDVEFSDGIHLVAASDPNFESWEIAGGGVWIIANVGVGETPGDWSPPARRSASD